MYYNILLTGINYGKNGIIMLLIACTIQYYTVVHVYALYMPLLAIDTQSHALVFAFTPCLLQYGTTHGDERGFGDNAPNKLMASAAGMGSEPASDPCRRHGQKLVYNIQQGCPRMDAYIRNVMSALVSSSSEARADWSAAASAATVSQLR